MLRCTNIRIGTVFVIFSHFASHLTGRQWGRQAHANWRWQKSCLQMHKLRLAKLQQKKELEAAGMPISAFHAIDAEDIPGNPEDPESPRPTKNEQPKPAKAPVKVAAKGGKKPQGPYFRWMNGTFRAQFKASHPDAKPTEVGKAAGEAWKLVDAETKAALQAEYEAEKAAYDEANPPGERREDKPKRKKAPKKKPEKGLTKFQQQMLEKEARGKAACGGTVSRRDDPSSDRDDDEPLGAKLAKRAVVASPPTLTEAEKEAAAAEAAALAKRLQEEEDARTTEPTTIQAQDGTEIFKPGGNADLF